MVNKALIKITTKNKVERNEVIETETMTQNEMRTYVKTLGHHKVRILRMWNGEAGKTNLATLKETDSNLVKTIMEKGGLKKLKVA